MTGWADLQSFFGVAGGALGFVSYLLYAQSVLRGRSKPNSATWIATSAVWLVVLVSYFLVGARDSLWFTVGSAAGSLIVASLSLRYGVRWERADTLCMAGAACAVIWGFATHSALQALYASMAVDFFALLPTIRKTWTHPDWEGALPWTITWVAGALTVAAVDLPWRVEIALYPAYVLAIDGVVLALILRPRLARSGGG